MPVMQTQWLMTCALAMLLGAGCNEPNAMSDPSSKEPTAESSSALFGQRRAGVHMVPARFTTSELGDEHAVYVRLTSLPRAPVTLHISSDDLTEGSVQPASLVFSALSWWIPRRVTVKGVHDLILDGDVTFHIRAQVQSNDASYAALQPATITGTNLDAAAFHGLGDLSGGEPLSAVSALNTTGQVAVGYSSAAAGEQAFLWTVEGGLRALAGEGGRALGVSPDGKTVVGSLPDTRWEGGRAAVIWRAADAPPDYFHEPIIPPTDQIMWFVKAVAVTDAGEVFGECVQYRAYGEHLACRTPIGVANLLSPASLLFAATPAGNAYAGTMLPSRYPLPAFASSAVLNGRVLGYPSDTTCLAPHGCESEARDLSADGSIAVGTALVPPAGPFVPGAPLSATAWVYSEAEGMLRLPGLAGGDGASGALAVNDDGSVIAGFAHVESGQQATLWLERSPVTVAELLSAANAPVPEGWQLTVVRALSGDGRTIAGDGFNPAGEPEAWRAVLPDL